MKRMWTAALLPVVAFSFAACRVTKTEEGEAPDVDVKVEEGKLPQYDVDPAKVEIKADTKKVVVPDVDVKVPPKKNH
jgi:hypothetical protein